MKIIMKCTLLLLPLLLLSCSLIIGPGAMFRGWKSDAPVVHGLWKIIAYEGKSPDGTWVRIDREKEGWDTLYPNDNIYYLVYVPTPYQGGDNGTGVIRRFNQQTYDNKLPEQYIYYDSSYNEFALPHYYNPETRSEANQKKIYEAMASQTNGIFSIIATPRWQGLALSFGLEQITPLKNGKKLYEQGGLESIDSPEEAVLPAIIYTKEAKTYWELPLRLLTTSSSYNGFSFIPGSPYHEGFPSGWNETYYEVAQEENVELLAEIRRPYTEGKIVANKGSEHICDDKDKEYDTPKEECNLPQYVETAYNSYDEPHSELVMKVIFEKVADWNWQDAPYNQ